MRIKHLLRIAAFTLLFIQTYSVAPVMAESRTAGSVHVKAPSETKTSNHNITESIPSVDAPHVNFARLESHGLLTRPKDGGLGRDVWRGTKRSLLLTYLPQLPSLSQYRTLQNLSKRLLLTKADPRLIKQDEKPEAGNDLTTLRIEKLLEMGAHKEALALYTKHPELPYHERFARAGILAAFYNKQPSLACLETKTIETQFKNEFFWQQTSKICGHVLSNSTPKNKKELKFPESKILQQVVEKDSYRFKPKKMEDFKDLTPLETAILIAENRLDLSRLVISSEDKLPQHVLALLLEEPSIKTEPHFRLMVQAVEQGLQSTENLAEYYDTKAALYFGKNKEKTSLTDYKAIKGWKRLPYLHRAASNAAQGEELTAIIEKSLGLTPEYGSAALWPFAEIIAVTDPQKLDQSMIRYGLNILVETGVKIPPTWNNTWISKYKKKQKNIGINDILQHFSYMLGEEFFTKEATQGADFKERFAVLEVHKQQLIKIIYEKLDKQLELDDYSANDVYEKPLGLTSNVDYVMPSTGLLDSLESAKYEQRLGEVILLSSIALRDAAPDEIYAGLFQKVIDGLVAVGLTEEARSLAREVMLGLSREKIKGEK